MNNFGYFSNPQFAKNFLKYLSIGMALLVILWGVEKSLGLKIRLEGPNAAFAQEDSSSDDTGGGGESSSDGGSGDCCNETPSAPTEEAQGGNNEGSPGGNENEGSNPEASPSPAPSPTPTITPTPVPSPSPTPNPTPSPTPQVTPSPTPSLMPSPSPIPSPTPQITPSPTPMITPSPAPSPSANTIIACAAGFNQVISGNTIVCVSQNQSQNQVQNNNQTQNFNPTIDIKNKNINENKSEGGNITLSINKEIQKSVLGASTTPTTTSITKGGIPQVISQANTGVTELPKTGLPLAGFAISSLLPLGIFGKKYRQGDRSTKVSSPNSEWMEYQFKKN